MKPDKQTRESIGPGHILQINPLAALSFPVKPGMVLIVHNVQDWGCQGTVIGGPDGFLPIAWDSLEDTGGRIVLDDNGQPIKPIETLRHHP